MKKTLTKKKNNEKKKQNQATHTNKQKYTLFLSSSCTLKLRNQIECAFSNKGLSLRIDQRNVFI
jgi:hypothetical protein